MKTPGVALALEVGITSECGMNEGRNLRQQPRGVGVELSGWPLAGQCELCHKGSLFYFRVLSDRAFETIPETMIFSMFFDKEIDSQKWFWIYFMRSFCEKPVLYIKLIVKYVLIVIHKYAWLDQSYNSITPDICIGYTMNVVNTVIPGITGCLFRRTSAQFRSEAAH